MNYMEIKTCDIANGVGPRTSLFVSGCPIHCPGCFNSEAWDFDAGKPFTEEVVNYILDTLKPDYIDGLSILGGEPLADKNIKVVQKLVKTVKEAYPEKSIWLWTGYNIDDLMLECNPHLIDILTTIDVLVDRPFEQDKHELGLRFRGSSNQRLIDAPASVELEKTVLWHDEPLFESREWHRG